MHSDYLLWLGVVFYALHVLEEYAYDWKTWAVKRLHLPVDWTTFYITNAGVIVLGIACAAIGWCLPGFSLVYPALMLINALFFHLLPTITARKFSPGLITALVLFLPITFATYYGAANDGVLTPVVLLISLTGGALSMAYPILLLKTRHLTFFAQ
jgi:hypothetical protein